MMRKKRRLLLTKAVLPTNSNFLEGYFFKSSITLSAKYDSIKSAPARLIEIKDSKAHESLSNQPSFEAAHTLEYSPET